MMQPQPQFAATDAPVRRPATVGVAVATLAVPAAVPAALPLPSDDVLPVLPASRTIRAYNLAALRLTAGGGPVALARAAGAVLVEDPDLPGAFYGACPCCGANRFEVAGADGASEAIPYPTFCCTRCGVRGTTEHLWRLRAEHTAEVPPYEWYRVVSCMARDAGMAGPPRCDDPNLAAHAEYRATLARLTAERAHAR